MRASTWTLAKMLALGLLLWPSLGAAEEQTASARCDQLAASPYDPAAAGPEGGVAFAQIDADAAIAACSAAVDASPADARLIYQLGRAHDAAEHFDQALEYYGAAADKGSLLAKSSLGALYDLGLGVPSDPEKAAQLYEEAAEGGILVAKENLGKLYEDGRGVPQDYAKAASLYRETAEAGSAYGSGALGWLTQNGFGVPQDDVEAVRLYRIAADGGEAFAQHNLGVMYSKGRGGLTADDAEALRYFNLAAEQNWPPAFISLGWVYSDGRGAEKDLARAEQYLVRALNEGEPATQADAKNDLAWMWANQNVRLDEAESLARDAVAANASANRLDTLAWVLHVTGRDTEALPLITQAVALDGESAVYRAHLEAIQAKLKN